VNDPLTPEANASTRPAWTGLALRSAFVIGSTALFTWADQISKDWAYQQFRFGLSTGQPHDLLRFTCHMNKGTAWGFCSVGHWYGLPTVILVIGVVLGAVMAFSTARPRGGSVASEPAGRMRGAAMSAMVDALAFSLLVAGALGNALDRFRRGSVVDFIDVGIGSTRWPTFNVADACLVVGIYLVLTGALADLVPRHDAPHEHERPPASRIGIFAGVAATAAIGAAVMAVVGRACETSLEVHRTVVAVLSWLGIGVVAVLLYGYVRLEMRRLRRPGGADPPANAENGSA
jgi:lipoprotein signal peptidase